MDISRFLNIIRSSHVLSTIVLFEFIFSFCTTVNSASIFSEGWDNCSVAGWTTVTTHSSVDIKNIGGNPAGYLFTNDIDWGYAGASNSSTECTGDYSSAHITQVSFDLMFIQGSIDSTYFRVRYLDSSHNGWHYNLPGPYTLGKWIHYVITFNPRWSDSDAIAAGWTNEEISAPFKDTMANVYYCEIRTLGCALITPRQEVGIDNFQLNSVNIPGEKAYLSFAPLYLINSCIEGSNATSQNIQIWNSGGETLDYTCSTNQSWLSCTQSSGSSSNAEDRQTITINYSTSNLAPGNYSAIITVNSSGASNNPQAIPVSLAVSENTNLDQLTMSLDPTSLSASCSHGADTDDQTFQLWNSGGGTINYSLSTDADWITLTPSNGAVAGDHSTITVHLKTSRLAVGEYDQNITITSTDAGITNSPQTIPLHISVKASDSGSQKDNGGGGGGCFIAVALPTSSSLSILYLFILIGVWSMSFKKR